MTTICPECACPYDAQLIQCPECGCPNQRLDEQRQVQLARQHREELSVLHQHHEQVAEMIAEQATALNNQHVARSLMRTLKRVFTRCAEFTGRARRSEFWTFIAFNCMMVTVLYIILFASIGRDYITISAAPTSEEYWHRLIHSCLSNHLAVTLLILGYLLLILLPLLSVTVRRLHDTNRSGYWILLGVLPFFFAPEIGISPYVGILILSIMLLLDSAPSNKYGRHPLQSLKSD